MSNDGTPPLALERWVCCRCGILEGSDEEGARWHEGNYGVDRHVVTLVRFVPESDPPRDGEAT